MPLVRLEVDNFKSYKGRQTIGPFGSFTSVIGPNGSGKSNLMDAISFVLGVKSAQLRSNQLRDLIYRGGVRDDDGDDEMRSDDGSDDGNAPTRASVMAVYKDQSGKEFKFQRSITLQGASEYRINNRVMSHSAYNERLQTFDILVKAKNFLVFQGDVEAVAQQSPRDLSRLIEQISGSLELRDDYDAAKAALARATDNSTFAFNRRRGLNAELKQFREQKSEAERYERLQTERDDHILHHLLWRLFHIEQDVNLATAKIDNSSGGMPKLRRAQRDADSRADTARRALVETERALAKQERSLRKRQRDLESQQPGLDAIEEKIRHSQRKARNAEAICQDIERDLERHEANVERLEAAHEAARAAADEAAAEQEAAAAAQGQALSAADLAEYRELRRQAGLRAMQERSQLEALSREIRTQRASVAALEERLAQQQRQREKLAKEEASLRERKQAVEARRKELDDALTKKRSEQAEAEAERQRIRARELELNEQLQATLNSLKEATADQQESERDRKLGETLRTLQRIFPGVKGRVSDLCKPTQRKYDVAITTVLGRHADAVVVEDEKTAIDCIEYLRGQRAGQLTFLPLDTIQTKPVNDRLRNLATGARLAIDVLQFDATFERAMLYACGNALVCDTTEIAKHICYDRRQEVKAITLDGTVIHKSGNITGGQTGESRAKRWEDHEVEGLQRKRDACMAELTKLGKERYALVSTGDEGARIGRLETELASVRDDAAAVTRRLDGVVTETTTIDADIADVSSRLTVARDALSDVEARAATLVATVDAEDDVVFANFCARIGVANIREYEARQLRLLEQQGEARFEYERQTKRLGHQLAFERSQLQEQRARLDANRSVVTRERTRQDDLSTERDDLQAAIDATTADIAQLQSRLELLQDEEEDRQVAHRDARKAAERAGREVEGAIREVAALNDELEKLSSERTAIFRRCRLEEIELPLLRGRLADVPLEDTEGLAPMDVDEEQTQRAIDVPDYGIEVDYEELEDEERDDKSGEMARQLVGRIDAAQAEIDALTPNMRAMERLDDAESKLRSVEKEFDSARREMQRARDDFEKIKKRRCDLFNAAFDHISKRINDIYKELTKGKATPMGGVAYLTLEDTEEPYLHGVLYHAMPALKKFRQMSDLSGGEKSMASLALLMAIHDFRPSPFFLLDEVDSALDQTNTSRLGRFLRQRANLANFQVIIMTHKASLYELSSSLVGIYRDQPKRSSSSLTLDLEQYNA